MKKTLALLLSFTIFFSMFAGFGLNVSAADTEEVLYVDPVNGKDSNDGSQNQPLRTISKAKSKAASLSQNSNVTVWLKGGRYAVSEPIRFTAAHSGKNGHIITFKAAPGETPILSGGTAITAWDEYDAEKGIYVADVPDEALEARQFYVDHEHQTRAMTEKSPTEWEISGTKGYLSPAVDMQESTESLTLDLGEVKNVSYLTLYTGTETDRNGNAAGFPVDFTIETSVDGTDYVVRHTETGHPAPKAKNKETFTFEAAEARFVRLNVSKLGTSPRLNPGKYMLAISEMETGFKDTKTPQEVDYSRDLLVPGCVKGLYQMNPEQQSYVNPSYPLENMVDDNPDTFTSSHGYWKEWLKANGGGLAPWIEMELSADGTPVWLGAVRMTIPSTEFNLLNNLSIEVSTNGTDWKSVFSDSDFSWTENTATFTFDPVPASKLRIVVKDISNSEDGTNLYYRISELEAFGVKSTVNVDFDSNLLAPGCVEGLYHLNPDQQSYLNATWPLDNLVDGDPETFISSNGYWADWLKGGGGGLAPWIDVNLTEDGSAVSLAAVKLVLPALNNFPTDFVIETSLDGTAWTPVHEERAYDWGGSTSALFTFDATEASKLRITVRNITEKIYPTDDLYLRLAELEAYAGTSQERPQQGTWKPVSIEALHEAEEASNYALTAINGTPYDNTRHMGYAVPEEFGLASFRHPEDIEINIIRWWYHRIIKTEGISPDGKLIYFDKSRLGSLQGDTFADRITYLENAYEFIDQPGEWYLDRHEKKIYYKSNEDPNGKEAVLPVTDQLLTFSHCENICFDGLIFENTSWTVPNELGYLDAQSGTYEQKTGPWGDVPGAIQTAESKNITITNSELRCLGGGGIRLGNGSESCTVSNNAIHDISSGGIWVGNNTGHGKPCAANTLVKDNVIRNNYITRIGLDIFDSSAITVLYTEGTVVDHNEICHTPYTGITLGWGWDIVDTDCAKNNTVSNNYIHDTGKTTHDGACIYTLGDQPGSRITGNYVLRHSDGKNSKDAGIYLDEGTVGIEVSENVVGEGVYWWSTMWTASIQDNYWHDNFHSVERERDNGTNNRMENNTFVPDGDFSKYPAAQEIIDTAGLLDPAVKAGIAEGCSSKHSRPLIPYTDGTSYLFGNPQGLLTFSISNQIGSTLYDWVTREIKILMPENTDLTSLSGIYTMNEGFTCDKESGSVQDFSVPVLYTFQSGGETSVWTIRVTCNETASGELTGTEMTLDEMIANPGDWTKPPVMEDGGARFTEHSVYIGSRIPKDAILEFDMKSALRSDQDDWTGFALRVQNPDNWLETMYHITFKYNCVELQKWVGGVRTMLFGTIPGYEPVFGNLENKYYTSNVRHSIKTGAVPVSTGVRLFLYVDGNKVFDVIDADAPIADDGFFSIYPVTQNITLLPYSNIQLHQHSFGGWKHDAENHWKECDCGEKAETGAHQFDGWKTVKEPSASTEGRKERTCKVCGRVESAAIPASETIIPLPVAPGWKEAGGNTYYYVNGRKATGLQEIEGSSYYFDEHGAMLRSGWVKQNGWWYFFGADGKMAKDQWIDWKGCRYRVSRNGAMYEYAWVVTDGVWHYLGHNGVMAKDAWVKGKDEKWYYLKPDGDMAVSQWAMGKDERWYYVGKDGAMLTSTRTPDGYSVNESGAWIL